MIWSWETSARWFVQRASVKFSVPLPARLTKPIRIHKLYVCEITNSLIIEGTHTECPPNDSRLPTLHWNGRWNTLE